MANKVISQPVGRLRVHLSARFGVRSRLDAGGWVAPGPRAEAAVFHVAGGKRDARFSLSLIFSFLHVGLSLLTTYYYICFDRGEEKGARRTRN